MRKITSLLSEEHETILGRLNDFERALDTRSLDGLWETVRFLEFGVALHRRKEEDALFPRLAEAMGTSGGPVDRMIEEHRMEREQVRAFREALETGNLGAADERGRALLDFIRAHIQKEEIVLFPLAERVITIAQRDQILLDYEAIGAIAREADRAFEEHTAQKADVS